MANAAALEPVKVKPMNHGQLVNGVEFFKLLRDLQEKKQVGTVLTHSQLDRATTVFWNQLDGESKSLLRNYWARGRTILGKPEDGGELKRVFTSSDSGLSVEVVIPKILLDGYRGKDARGKSVAFDLTDNNCRITVSADCKSATVELLDPASAVVLALANAGLWGKANESTLWIPVKGEVPDASRSENRYFNAPKGEFAGAPSHGRYFLGGYYYGRSVVALGPPFRAGVLELVQGASVASAKPVETQATAKPDLRALAASADEAAGSS